MQSMIDSQEWGIIGFILSAAGLTVAVCFKAISESTYVSLMTPCLVGIGSLSNASIRSTIGRVKDFGKVSKISAPTGKPTLTP